MATTTRSRRLRASHVSWCPPTSRPSACASCARPAAAAAVAVVRPSTSLGAARGADAAGVCCGRCSPFHWVSLLRRVVRGGRGRSGRVGLARGWLRGNARVGARGRLRGSRGVAERRGATERRRGWVRVGSSASRVLFPRTYRIARSPQGTAGDKAAPPCPTQHEWSAASCVSCPILADAAAAADDARGVHHGECGGNAARHRRQSDAAKLGGCHVMHTLSSVAVQPNARHAAADMAEDDSQFPQICVRIQSFSIPVGSFLIQGWIATELLLSSQFWPMPSMSRGVINCAKQFLSHPFSRIKSFDQWAVDRDPVLTSTTSAKIGKTAIGRQTIAVHNSDRPMQVGYTNWKTLKISQQVGLTAFLWEHPPTPS